MALTSSILSAEQLAQITAEDSAPASPPAPEAAPVTETAAERAVYEEDASPPETEAQPSTPASTPRPTFKAKVYGQEEEVPVLLDDGTVNPEIVKRYQQAGAFYTVSEKLAQAQKELEELRGRPATTAPAVQPQPTGAEQELSDLKEMAAKLPADDPYSQVLNGLIGKVEGQIARQRQIEQMEQSRAASKAREELEIEEKGIREKFDADDNSLQLIRQITFARWQAGNMSPMTKVAEEFFGHIAKAEEKGVSKWKEKHRVQKGAPPSAAAGTPPPGPPGANAPLSLDKGDVRRAVLSHLEAIGG